MHIVAHSKGGLDTRSWFSTNNAKNVTGTAMTPGFRVISLTTLSTPHRGSALADLLVAIDATSVGLFGFTVANLKSLGLATPDIVDLTTFSAGAFNPPLPSGTDYRMLGADADLNGNGVIDSAPVDEYLAARGENATLAGIFGRAGHNHRGNHYHGTTKGRCHRYHRIPDSAQCSNRGRRQCDPFPFPDRRYPYRTRVLPPLVIVTASVPSPIFGPAAPNDLLVTIGSAIGAPAPPFIVPFTPFTGAAGREHASIANAGVATLIIPFLITTDVTRGDLK